MGRRLDRAVHTEYKKILEAANKLKTKKESAVFCYSSGGSRRTAVDQNWTNLTIASLLERDGFNVSLEPNMDDLAEDNSTDWDTVELKIVVRK